MHKPKVSRRNKIITSIVLLAIIAIPFTLITANNTQPVSATTESSARLGNVNTYIEADGSVSVEKTNVNFTQTGTLRSINVKIGDQVNKNDILATIDNAKLQYQLDQANAAYNTNIAKANRLKPDTGEEIIIKERAVNIAKDALKAETNIYNDIVSKNSLGSSQELSEYAKLVKAESDLYLAEAQLELTKATYNDALYAVSSSLASLNSAQLALAETSLISPIDGIVTSVNGTIGQSTGGTQQSTTSLITISKINNLTLVSNLDEEDITKIKISQKIEAEFAALNKTVNGNVTYISPVAKIDSNGAATYEVRISFDKKDLNIIDGMTANIKFMTKSVENVIKILNKAVNIIDKKTTVSYYDQSRNILSKEIVTGFTDGQYVEVINGLAEGDKYIVTSIK